MSILDALETQSGPIRELAKLPQQQILNMAQMKQIDVSMVPVILNEKAQMIQQAANARALAQNTPASVTETNMAINAQADAAAAAPPAGLEALPVPDDMYSEQSLAAGGIVAFERGGQVAHFQNTGMVSGTPDPQYLRAYYLSRGLPLPEELMTEEEKRRKPYPAGIFPRMGRAFSDIGESISNVVSPGGADFYSTQAPAPARAAPPTTAQYQAQDIQEGYASAPVGGAAAPAQVPVRPAASAPAAAAAPAKKLPSIADYLKEAREAAPPGQAYEGLEKSIQEGAGQRKADKEQSFWMRVAEAGFGMMSGTSPYAMVNIGQSLSSAMKSYADDLKEQKKLDREDRRLLADIEQARRAEALGQYDKAAMRTEKALDRMSEDDRARLLRETQERVARISAANRPSPFQEYLQNPEKYAEFSKVVRPGFESADTQRDRLALDMISNELMTMKKDDPRRKQLEQTRQSIMQKLIGPSFGGSLNMPSDISSIVKMYTGK